MKKRTWFMCVISLMMIGVMLMGSACSSKDKATEQNIEESADTQAVDESEKVSESTPENVIEVIEEVSDDVVSDDTVSDGATSEIAVVLEEEPEKESEMELCQVVHCNEFITLRTEPSTSGAEICKIPLGSDVYYIENAENGFVKIMYEGQEGYSLASYLNFTKEEGAIFMKVYNCQESITLRKIPSTKAEEFCQIPLGEKVIFRESAENGFYMVSYNGYTGYALAEYLIEW